jgi:hypothetical protein
VLSVTTRGIYLLSHGHWKLYLGGEEEREVKRPKPETGRSFLTNADVTSSFSVAAPDLFMVCLAISPF